MRKSIIVIFVLLQVFLVGCAPQNTHQSNVYESSYTTQTTYINEKIKRQQAMMLAKYNRTKMKSYYGQCTTVSHNDRQELSRLRACQCYDQYRSKVY
ncbi:MAG: hypothetical protein QM500_17765 [Methylococcales bacterium]